MTELKKLLAYMLVSIASVSFMIPVFAVETTNDSTLDFSNVIEDTKGNGWAWDSDTKTLTLTNFTLTTDSENAIILPNGSTIQLKGTNKILTTNTNAKALLILGSVNILGDGTSSLEVSAGGGYTIYMENVDADVTLTVSDANINIVGAKTQMSANNKTSSVNIKNSIIKSETIEDDGTVKQNEQRFEIYYGKNNGEESETASFNVEDSTLIFGKLHVQDSSLTEGKLMFNIKNSTIKPTQSSGSVQEAGMEIKAHNLDLDINKSMLYAWTRGYSYTGNAYGIRIDAKGDADINIQGSDITGYGSSTGFYIDVVGTISSTSSIEDSTILSYAKVRTGELHIWDTDGANGSKTNGYADIDRKEELIKDSIVLEYSNMTQSSPSGVATVIGNPVLSHDFTLPQGIGGTADLSLYTPELVLMTGQTITIEEGVSMTMPESIPLILSSSSRIDGNFEGPIAVSDEENGYVVVFDYGDQVLVFSVLAGNYIDEVPAAVPENSWQVFNGWYAEGSTVPFNFDEPVTESITLYPQFIGEEPVPETLDNVMVYIVMMITSIIGLTMIGYKKIKSN